MLRSTAKKAGKAQLNRHGLRHVRAEIAAQIAATPWRLAKTSAPWLSQVRLNRCDYMCVSTRMRSGRKKTIDLTILLIVAIHRSGSFAANKWRLYVFRNYLIDNSHTNAVRCNSRLAAQSRLGLWPKRWSGIGRGYSRHPSPARPNMSHMAFPLNRPAASIASGWQQNRGALTRWRSIYSAQTMPR